MTHERFLAALGLLCETFRVPMTDGLTEGYWLALREAPDEAVSGGLVKAIETCKFMPAPAELLTLSGVNLRRMREIAAEERARQLLDRMLAPPANPMTPEQLEQMRADIKALADAKGINNG